MIAKVNKDEIIDDQDKEEESSDAKTIDSMSSQGDSLVADDEIVERTVGLSRNNANKDSSERPRRGSRAGSESETKRTRSKSLNNTLKKPTNNVKEQPKTISNKYSATKSSKDLKFPSKSTLEHSEIVDDKISEEVKENGVSDAASNGDQNVAQEIDAFEEISNGAHIIASENENVNGEENSQIEQEALNKKIEEMETRIEKLEEELREVAALEISLYSVVPEHGNSAHKVHTAARRLFRLYIHACKHLTQDKRATIAKNTVSGLVLISKSCGNDVPRLTFWLSNTVVLREIISEAFGIPLNSNLLARLPKAHVANTKGTEGKSSSVKWKKGSLPNKQGNVLPLFFGDWQETRTLTAALLHVESWIFTRIVESVWWQALTPYMQSPEENLYGNKATRILMGPVFGDLKQGNFSINLWKKAFNDAFQRLCPVRADGHNCGCLPMIARKVMEQSIARLDVAMFNAILRESVHEIPTDPVSDPIVDSSVLPISAGELNFGSGAQLKNSVGSWSRWLVDVFGIESNDYLKKDEHDNKSDGSRERDEFKSFNLLDELSDLLMLPKDMLMDRSVRKEVCPSISLSLIKRILCNFTPDEFCPDSVPGTVLEALNAESIVERRLAGESSRSFPYAASPVIYNPPSSNIITEKVADFGDSKSQLSRNISVVKKKGYTSDDELEELEYPFASIVDTMQSSPASLEKGNKKKNGSSNENENENEHCKTARFELLQEVWSKDTW